MTVACGAGTSADRAAEVTYRVPAPDYQSFRTAARASGERGSQALVSVLLDGRTVESAF